MANVITSAAVDAFMQSPTTEEMRVCSGVSGHVATMADLKAVPVEAHASGSVMQVDGYDAVGDGRGGPFCYDPASVLVDNGTTVIKPTVGAGRWLRMVDGPVLKSPDGTLYRIAVANGGALSTTLA